jgi:predicted 3-demethylubiquinone-9 3-methyltransferase (glyoxalase superfamily)
MTILVMNFYASVFKNSKVLKVNRFDGGESGPRGGFMMGTFQLGGQEFMALSLNAAAPFKFTEAMLKMTKMDIEKLRRAAE